VPLSERKYGGGGINPLILNVGTTHEWSPSHRCRFTTREQSTCVHWKGGWGGEVA